MLRALYGSQAIILEEFGIPDERLFVDFYLPHHSLAFEFQGTQHDEFNKFFHVDKAGFDKSKARDNRKREWCEMNSIRLVEVRETVTSDQLKALIQASRANDE